MAIIKPKQLESEFYTISGSFSGSFQGDGSNLTGIVAPIPPRITFNSVTASVENSDNIFLVTSASVDLFQINTSGSVTINSNGETPFLVKNPSNDEILSVSQSGVVVLATQSAELTSTAPNGGIYFTSSSFFVGLD